MTTRRRELWVGAVLGVAFVVARVVPFVGTHIGTGFDSFDYLAAARLTPLSKAFLAGSRPFGYPLYLKAVRHNEHAAVVGQLVVDTVAWLVLAFMAARATRDPRLRIAAVVVVLGLGATFDSIQWDRIISSEAISTAAGVGMLAALLWLRERWTGPRVALVGVLALVAMTMRDSNGTFFGVVAVVLAIGVAVRLLRARVLVLAAVLLAVAIAGTVSAGIGKRWQEPLQNVMTIRLFNSPERLRSLYHSGLPLTLGQVAEVRGRCISAQPLPSCLTLPDPAFYDWVQHHAREAYLHSMEKTPATTVWEPLAHLRYSIGTRDPVDIAAGTNEQAPVAEAFETIFNARNPALDVTWAVAFLVLAAVAWQRRRRGVYVLAVALVLLVYPHLWLVWAGDALEVTRHSLLASIQLRIGLWLGSVWLLDAFLAGPESPAAPVDTAR